MMELPQSFFRNDHNNRLNNQHNSSSIGHYTTRQQQAHNHQQHQEDKLSPHTSSGRHRSRSTPPVLRTPSKSNNKNPKSLGSSLSITSGKGGVNSRNKSNVNDSPTVGSTGTSSPNNHSFCSDGTNPTCCEMTQSESCDAVTVASCATTGDDAKTTVTTTSSKDSNYSLSPQEEELLEILMNAAMDMPVGVAPSKSKKRQAKSNKQQQSKDIPVLDHFDLDSSRPEPSQARFFNECSQSSPALKFSAHFGFDEPRPNNEFQKARQEHEMLFTGSQSNLHYNHCQDDEDNVEADKTYGESKVGPSHEIMNDNNSHNNSNNNNNDGNVVWDMEESCSTLIKNGRTAGGLGKGSSRKSKSAATALSGASSGGISGSDHFSDASSDDYWQGTRSIQSAPAVRRSPSFSGGNSVCSNVSSGTVSITTKMLKSLHASSSVLMAPSPKHISPKRSRSCSRPRRTPSSPSSSIKPFVSLSPSRKIPDNGDNIMNDQEQSSFRVVSTPQRSRGRERQERRPSSSNSSPRSDSSKRVITTQKRIRSTAKDPAISEWAASALAALPTRDLSFTGGANTDEGPTDSDIEHSMRSHSNLSSLDQMGGANNMLQDASIPPSNPCRVAARGRNDGKTSPPRKQRQAAGEANDATRVSAFHQSYVARDTSYDHEDDHDNDNHTIQTTGEKSLASTSIRFKATKQNQQQQQQQQKEQQRPKKSKVELQTLLETFGTDYSDLVSLTGSPKKVEKDKVSNRSGLPNGCFLDESPAVKNSPSRVAKSQVHPIKKNRRASTGPGGQYCPGSPGGRSYATSASRSTSPSRRILQGDEWPKRNSSGRGSRTTPVSPKKKVSSRNLAVTKQNRRGSTGNYNPETIDHGKSPLEKAAFVPQQRRASTGYSTPEGSTHAPKYMSTRTKMVEALKEINPNYDYDGKIVEESNDGDDNDGDDDMYSQFCRNSPKSSTPARSSVPKRTIIQGRRGSTGHISTMNLSAEERGYSSPSQPNSSKKETAPAHRFRPVSRRASTGHYDASGTGNDVLETAGDKSGSGSSPARNATSSSKKKGARVVVNEWMGKALRSVFHTGGHHASSPTKPHRGVAGSRRKTPSKEPSQGLTGASSMSPKPETQTTQAVNLTMYGGNLNLYNSDGCKTIIKTPPGNRKPTLGSSGMSSSRTLNQPSQTLNHSTQGVTKSEDGRKQPKSPTRSRADRSSRTLNASSRTFNTTEQSSRQQQQQQQKLFGRTSEFGTEIVLRDNDNDDDDEQDDCDILRRKLQQRIKAPRRSSELGITSSASVDLNSSMMSLRQHAPGPGVGAYPVPYLSSRTQERRLSAPLGAALERANSKRTGRRKNKKYSDEMSVGGESTASARSGMGDRLRNIFHRSHRHMDD